VFSRLKATSHIHLAQRQENDSDTSPAALPVDPAIEEKAAKFRAKLYAQDKTRRILTGSSDIGIISADKDTGK